MDQGCVLGDIFGDLAENSPSLGDVSLVVFAGELIGLPARVDMVQSTTPQLAPIVLLTLTACSRITPQVVEATDSDPTTCLAVPPIRTAVNPAAVPGSLLGASLGRIEDAGGQPGAEGDDQQESQQNSEPADPKHNVDVDGQRPRSTAGVTNLTERRSEEEVGGGEGREGEEDISSGYIDGTAGSWKQKSTRRGEEGREGEGRGERREKRGEK